MRDANGYVSEIQYDSSDTYPVKKINPKGQEETTEYYGVDGVDADFGLPGQVKSVTSPTGAIINFKYDSLGRKVLEDPSDDSWTYWSYNNFGSTVPFGESGSQYVYVYKYQENPLVTMWSKNYFDGFQRTVKTLAKGPDGKTIVTERAYNSLGQLSANSIPAFVGDPQLWAYTTYDPLGRITRIDNPDGTSVESCYSLNVAVQVDANGHRKRQTKDVKGNLVRVDEYDDSVTACTTDIGSPYATTNYDYDVLGNLTSVTDAHGNQTLMDYDSLGRKVTMDDPDMGHWEYRYDPMGSLTWQKDAKLQEISFTYDSLGRMESKTYPDSSTVTYTYDDPTHGCPGDTATQGCAAGRMTSMVDASGRTDYYYDDPFALVSRKTQAVDGQSYTIETGKDSLGRISYVTYPDGETVGYDYDAAGNLWHVGSYATYDNYNALGQPGKVTYENGVTTDYTYDPLSQRLWTLNSTHDGNPLLDLTYGYDNKGNIKDILDSVHPDQSQDFLYDELDRLKSAKSTAYGELAYTYDEIGNLRVKGGGTDFRYSDTNGNGVWDEGIDQLRNSEVGDFIIPNTQFGVASDTPIVGDWNGDGKKDVGTFRAGGTNPIWNLDLNGDNYWDASETVSTSFGMSTDTPLVGDWNGDGVDDIGVWRNGTWYLDINGNFLWDAGDLQFSYGNPTDIPLVGDWNGDGIDTPGVKRGNDYYLRNSNSSGVADVTFIYGNPGDTPLVGDWDGDGTDTIGVKRSNTYLLRNSNTAGVADITFSFGISTDIPITGAWVAGTPDKVGVFRQGSWRFDRNGNGIWDLPLSPETVDFTRGPYGLAGDAPLAGDWNGDGLNGVAVFRNGEWRLDVDNNGIGSASDIFYPVFGQAGDLSVAGDWDGDGVTEIGVFRNGEWRLDVDNNGLMDAGDIFYPSYGLAGDLAISGDWDGDGVTEIGVFRNGEWRLDVDNDGVGSADDIYYPAFGNSTMIPVTGDWDGDGITEIGTFRDGTWYLDLNGNGQWDDVSGGDALAFFGNSTMTPLTGDWDADGKTEIGTYRDGIWYFDPESVSLQS